MSITDCIIRFSLSLVFSFCLGLERKSHQHTVGIRTLVLMGLSCTMLSMLSIVMAEVPSVKGDPTRIAAGVITGIGFLGGGAILKQGLNIRGLTTAAIIFTTSAIGMACGAGLYLPASITFGCAIIILFTMDKLEKRLFPASKTKLIVLKIATKNAASVSQEDLRALMKTYGVIVHDMNIYLDAAQNVVELSFTVKTPDKMDALKLTQEISEKYNDLKDFRICDK